MGILNLTPDSFSDGGKFNQLEAAMHRIEEMIAQGADIIDIGGESTGPGSTTLSDEEELARVKSVIDGVSGKYMKTAGMRDLASPRPPYNALFSIDTYKSSVAEYALEKGFQMVNDVTALRGDAKMIDVLVKYKPYVVLMFSKDKTARTTSDKVAYENVMGTIIEFLTEQTSELLEAGFPREKIILDPGMGAFLSGIPEVSFEVIHRLPELLELGYPVMVGISRKSCLGGKLEERDPASVEWSLKAIKNGTNIIRIHDVEGMRKALNG